MLNPWLQFWDKRHFGVPWWYQILFPRESAKKTRNATWYPHHTHTHTSVSGILTKLNLFSTSMSAILTSKRANRIPIQNLGPCPKGMWESGGRLAFSSAVNLKMECWDLASLRQWEKWYEPQWIKHFWILPILWVHVKQNRRENYSSATGNRDIFVLVLLNTLSTVSVKE